MNSKLTGIFKAAKYVAITLIFFSVSLLNSCKENTGSLGANVLPNSDRISAYQTDTSTIITSMFLKDSVGTNYGINALLGSFNDPVFGKSEASIYAEVYAPAGYLNPPWEVLGVLPDSAVVLLPVTGQYGNLDPQTFVVYRTDSNIIGGKTYYSDTTFKLQSSIPIGTEQVTPPNYTQNDTLRIKLSKNFLSYFSNQADFYWSTFNLHVIQGIEIATANPLQLPGQGGMLYLNLYSSFAGIYVYYHRKDTAYSVAFPIGGSSGAYFSHFSHDYATSPLSATRPLGKRDSVPASQLMYVQSMGGVSGRIYFPNLYKNWSKKGPVVINAAVINLPVNNNYIATNLIPSNLMLYATHSNWQGFTLPDYGEGYFGGTYNASTNSYTFTITQYIQSIIDGKNDSDRGLYIIPANSAVSANSVVLYGAQHGLLPANKASLTLYYTPLTH